jgi:hypothetical protein
VVLHALGYQCRIASCKPDSAWRGLKSRPGPKAAVTVEPFDLSSFPAPGWRRVNAFAREYLRVPKGGGRRTVQASPLAAGHRARDVPDAGYTAPSGLVSMPRGNGKTGLASVLALYGLWADEVEGDNHSV